MPGYSLRNFLHTEPQQATPDRVELVGKMTLVSYFYSTEQGILGRVVVVGVIVAAIITSEYKVLSQILVHLMKPFSKRGTS